MSCSRGRGCRTRSACSARSPAWTAQTRAPLVPIAGQPPLLVDLPPGCPFTPRCPVAVARCTDAEPPLAPVSIGHEVACVRAEGIADGRIDGVAGLPAPAGTRAARPGAAPGAAPGRAGAGRCQQDLPVAARCAVEAPGGLGVRGLRCRPGHPGGRDPRPRGRVGVREDHHAAGDHEPASAGAWGHQGGGRRRRGAARAARGARAAPPAADGVPGPDGIAGPADDRLRHPRRAAARAHRGGPRERRPAGQRADGAGGARPGARRPLPGRVLRRPAAADRDRPGAGHQPVAGRAGRAGVRAGRLDPGGRAQPAERPQGPAGDRRSCSWRTTSRWCGTSRTGWP